MAVNHRYNVVAITLHWVIAAALIANLGLGLWMSWAIDSPMAQARAVSAFQLHKSLGLTVLALSLLRLAWRFLYPPPPLPAQTARWERALAAGTHWLFYGLMIGLPLSGWLYVSAQWRGDAPFNIPTLWFGVFEVPHLFGLGEAGRALRAQAAAAAFNIHGAMALALVVLLALHVGAALKTPCCTARRCAGAHAAVAGNSGAARPVGGNPAAGARQPDCRRYHPADRCAADRLCSHHQAGPRCCR